MFFSQMRNAEPIAPVDLLGRFTPEEVVHLIELRRHYRDYPDRYRFPINFRRLEFTRWLVAHGYLDEWREGAAGQNRADRTRRTQKHAVVSALQFT